jgi:hypothetical protein
VLEEQTRKGVDRHPPRGALEVAAESAAPEYVEQSRLPDILKGVLIVAEAKSRAYVGVAIEQAEAARAADGRQKPSKEPRGLGELTEQAFEAAFLAFNDHVGTAKEPTTTRAWARAIADAAAAAGITPEGNALNPDSQSVRQPAEILRRAAARLRGRDAKG